MKDQVNKLNEIIDKLKDNIENIDSEDLKAMNNLREKLVQEKQPIDNELFRFATDPIIEKYDFFI